MKWINFLHIYQPPTQTSEVVKKISEESYFLILDLLAKYPDLKLTLNISGSLLELLAKCKLGEVIEGFKKYHDEGRIELVGSAMYHPILPLIPDTEVERQITLNTNALKKAFGKDIRLKGFYFPEMAYSDDAAKVVKKLGFEWIILDNEAHFPGGPDKLPDPTKLYEVKDVGLTVIFRDRHVSQTFPPEYIVSRKKMLPEVVITAHDGEMYGHRHDNDHGFFEQAFTAPDIKTVTASEYIASLDPATKIVTTLREASWESTQKELADGIPFAVWDAPGNDIQELLWEFAERTMYIIGRGDKDPNIKLARKALDKGLASCAWWWASERTLGAFSPPAWNPTEIEKGLRLQLRANRSMVKRTIAERNKTEELFSSLLELIWKRHWELYTKDNELRQ